MGLQRFVVQFDNIDYLLDKSKQIMIVTILRWMMYIVSTVDRGNKYHTLRAAHIMRCITTGEC